MDGFRFDIASELSMDSASASTGVTGHADCAVKMFVHRSEQSSLERLCPMSLEQRSCGGSESSGYPGTYRR